MPKNNREYPTIISDLQQSILKIYDHLYANASTRTPAGISKEVGKILHAAMYSEETTNKKPIFNFTRSELRDLNIADNFFAIDQANSIKNIFSQMNEVWQLYERNAKIDLEENDIAFVCGQLNGIVISDRQRDVFGDALEIFRSQWAKREGGQFFTDQRVTSLAMTLLEFDPRKGDDLIDICAGTGGFLLAGLNHIRQLLEEDPKVASVEIELVKLASKSLKGQEVDGEVCNIANATLGARLSTVKKPFVLNGDSLKLSFLGENNGLKPNSHFCAASNPPFGTKITIKDHRILKQFDLAGLSSNSTGQMIIESSGVYRRPPDILFLEQNIKMLKPGEGRLAIVLPYQILSGPQMFYVRNWLLRHTKVLSVIDLPNETFQPHTGTKTCLLVVERRRKPIIDPKDDSGEPVFMSIPKWIGHDRRGNPVYERMVDGKQSGQILTDFPQVEKAFLAFKNNNDAIKVHENSFIISSKQIIADPLFRLNALFHKPSSYVPKVNLKNKKNKWHSVKLGDVVDRVFYPPRFKRNYVEYYPGAIPFFGGSNITELIITTGKWLSPDDPKLHELAVKSGWILITRSGTTGIVSSVPSAWDNMAMSEHIIRIIPNPKKLDAAYIQAFLRTQYCQELLSKGVFGSVIDEITPEFVADLEILIPKSKDLFDSIIQSIRKAEESRQIVLEKLYTGIEELNSSLNYG